MISAFGVDHGDFSKRGGPAAPKKVLGLWSKKPPPAPVRTGPRPKSGPEKIKDKANQFGEADISLKGIGDKTGGGLKHAGAFLQERPGLTGGVLVGGGSAATYKYLKNKEPKRKRA
jgi:hypothetical protein